MSGISKLIKGGKPDLKLIRGGKPEPEDFLERVLQNILGIKRTKPIRPLGKFYPKLVEECPYCERAHDPYSLHHCDIYDSGFVGPMFGHPPNIDYI